MLEDGKETGQQTLAQKLESKYKEEEDAAARCGADSAQCLLTRCLIVDHTNKPNTHQLHS